MYLTISRSVYIFLNIIKYADHLLHPRTFEESKNDWQIDLYESYECNQVESTKNNHLNGFSKIEKRHTEIRINSIENCMKKPSV